jgi:hypothetical protein
MEAHKLAEARSLAYHQVIATRIRDDAGLLRMARERVAEWCRTAPVPHYAGQWREVLSMTTDQICSFLVEDSETAIELRQSSPFAGALAPQERWRLWREARAAAERSHDA